MKKIINKKLNAFTLTELIVAVLVIGIIAAVSVPRMNFSTIGKLNADVQSKKMVSLMRRTRALAVSNAATNSSGYRLSMTGGSPYSGYEIIDIGSSSTVDTGSIDSNIGCTGGSTFNFGPMGNRLSPTGTMLVVSDGGSIYNITVVSATGMVKCVKQ